MKQEVAYSLSRKTQYEILGAVPGYAANNKEIDS